MEPQTPVKFSSSEDPRSTVDGHALWQNVRRPRRGRSISQQTNEAGPYETSYSIATGYPDRDVVLP